MASKKTVRRRLFDKFVHHLKILRENSSASGEPVGDGQYLCPGCLRFFSETDLLEGAPNMLTIEHAPPEEIGGAAVALTCKDCNSKAGHKLDVHLINRIIQIEREKFLPKTKAKGKLVFDENGNTAQATITVSPTGLLRMDVNDDNNNPLNLSKLKAVFDSKQPVGFNFNKIRIEENRISIALLKTAYILVFSKFGYTFLLNEEYDLVRAQILNPEQEICPTDYVSYNIPESVADGVYPIENELGRGIQCIFTLVSSIGTAYRVGINLPLPGTPPSISMNNFRGPPNTTIELINQKEDYLFDLENMRYIPIWAMQRKLPIT